MRKSHFGGVVFGTRCGRPIEDDIFADFYDFGLQFGSPGETILRLLAVFVGFDFWSNSEEKGGAFLGPAGDRMRQWRVPA